MFEYKVVPAPVKGVKAKGVKTPEARFALGVEQAINDLAAEGWEYQRSDVLPSTERVGLTGSETHWRTLLVFRRAVAVAEVAAPPAPAARVEPVLTAAATAAVVTSMVPEGDDGVAEADSAAEPEFEEGSEETRPA
jgi:hypothetical protein